jgi:DMSO/TMAO reductase YedYZ molybdopterin-dependent catalytic subunit
MSDRFATRGFVGRRGSCAETDLTARTPPGQHLTRDFPVLSAGPTPRTPLDGWSLTIEGLVKDPVSWTWDELQALPPRDRTVDISCVTKSTKLDRRWHGVSVDTLLEAVELDPAAAFARSVSSTPTFARRALCSAARTATA